MAATRARPGTRPVARVEGYAPIGDYAAIGDGRTIALVARDGSIDWLPLPTIGGEPAFGALLDAARGGSFRLAPDGEFTASRRYVPRTNVLETTFETAGGTLRVTDALTLQDGALLPWVELARRVECTAGAVRVRWEVAPRLGGPGAGTSFALAAGVPMALGPRLRLAVLAWGLGSPRRTASSVAGTAELGAGESGLVACVAVDHEPVPQPTRDEVETRLEGTAAAWRRWLDGHLYSGPWREAVERSALALKLLIHAPTGAIAAAGTTGLPERIGGDRNYDYRFCWVRDSALTLDALSRLGYREQVHASLSWLLDATEATHPQLRPLYALDGGVPGCEEELPVPGYRGSRPVRRGNDAARQLQLGSYGDLFETVLHYVRHGNALDPATAGRLAETADHVCEIWREPDSGIWELDERRHYTISKLACWQALAVAARLADEGRVPAEGARRWRAAAAEVREFVETRCWSEAKRSYTMFADGETLDCAVLRAALFGYADAAGERMRGTIDAVLRELRADGPLLYRYGGMEREEGAFAACSFWLAAALARAGRVGEARALMEELLGLANDVGLWSEEIDPATGELLGNFPQALTHLSLVNAAAAVADAEGGAGPEG